MSARTILAAGGLRLSCRFWAPTEGSACAALVYIHGIASHAGWFADTAAVLAEAGVAVYGPDRRGSGLSDGPRGHVARYETLFDDLHAVLRIVRADWPGVPVFLAASSWGAKLAVPFVAAGDETLAGLALLAPGLCPRVGMTPVEKAVVLAALAAYPSFRLCIPLRPEQYTFDAAYREAIAHDPGRLLTATARFFWETGRLDRLRDAAIRQLSLPILLQMGGDDPMMDVAATRRLLQRVATPDVTIRIYPGAAHTLDFETEPTLGAYRAELLAWIARVAGAEPRATVTSASGPAVAPA